MLYLSIVLYGERFVIHDVAQEIILQTEKKEEYKALKMYEVLKIYEEVLKEEVLERQLIIEEIIGQIATQPTSLLTLLEVEMDKLKKFTISRETVNEPDFVIIIRKQLDTVLDGG